MRAPLKTNTLRIISGEYRRRQIEFPDVDGLRPTPDRVRETLFNWLGQTLHGKRCLDLFAGSGALGFEAASRGAAEVVMVEINPAAFSALQQNSRKLGCTGVALHREDGIKFAFRDGGRYDVIFLDPPFDSDALAKVLPPLRDRLTEDGLLYIETGAAFTAGAEWETVKQAKAGQVHYQLLQPARERD
jgi:16S rRNA (guanine966-N2)-methyltransferase